MILDAPKRARRGPASMKNHISHIKPFRLAAGRKCRETFHMILADDLPEPIPDMAPIAMNLGGDIPTEDLPIEHGDIFKIQDSDSEFHHEFIGYDD